MRKPYDNADKAKAAINNSNSDDIDHFKLKVDEDYNIVVPIKKFKSNHFHRITEVDHSNNSLTKCAKMTEEHGMIRNGSLNGVGIANILANFNYAAATVASVSSTPSTTIVSGTISNTGTGGNLTSNGGCPLDGGAVGGGNGSSSNSNSSNGSSNNNIR